MDRYETNQKGTSPALSAILNDFANMPRSPFDETRTKDLDVPFFGIIPIECFQMFPNSQGYLRYDVKALSKNPTIKRMLSNATIELRTYVCKNSDLWEGWNNFITRGRSGKVTKAIPFLQFQKTVNDKVYSSSLPYNPMHLLNIAPSLYYNNDLSFSGNTGIKNLTDNPIPSTDLLKTSNLGVKSFSSYFAGQSALPYVMYAKVAKEYQNPNLLQNNPNWYPENENHDLILPYNCTKACNATYDNPEYFFNETHDNVTYDELQPTNDSKSMPWLNVLYFKQRKGDYFNTASPFPDLLRGDIPTTNLLNSKIDWSDVVQQSTGVTGIAGGLLTMSTDNKLGILGIPTTYATDGTIKINPSSASADVSKYTKPWYSTTGSNDPFYQTYGVKGSDRTYSLEGILSKATVQAANFSMNEWRRLATMTVFKERMARCDGSYNQMIMAQFGHNPMWHEHSVRYCGGSTQPIVFSEVVQQSADSSSPLGTTAGRAFSDSTSREIYVKADDFSILMTVLCITPNTVYSQGIDRMWSELNQADQYFPIMNNLEPQAILNKELFVSGDPDIDEDVFAYQERFSHFKSRQNQVSGLMALPISKVGDTGAYLFNRLFDDTPNFNWDFVQGNMTDNENLCFASTEQAQFALHITSSFKYISPMPFRSVASTMGLSYC